MCQSDAAVKLKISQPTLVRILKDRANIKTMPDSDRKQLKRTGHFPQVDAAIAKWIRESCERKAIISGPLIMAKADQFAQMLDVQGQ